MDVSLKALRYFMAAANCGSITEASKEMNVVPSAVLAAVNQVEEAFGLTLSTRRRSKGIVLTSTGQILTTKIQHLLDEYETLMNEGADLKSKLTGTLRVGYYAPVAPAFVPAIVTSLMDGNPGVSFQFIECDNQSAQVGLLNGDFDVILFIGESVKSGIACQDLLDLPAYVLVSGRHALANRKSVRLSNLSHEKMVLLDLPIVSEYYRSILDDAGAQPNIVTTATSVEMVRSLVSNGVGCSILHMRPRSNLSYAGATLVELPISPRVKPLKLVLGHIEGNPRRLVRAFIDECEMRFRSREMLNLIVRGRN